MSFSSNLYCRDQRRGLPWLDKPVEIHSSRNDACTLSEIDCIYRDNLWRSWFHADRVYAQGTTYFCLSLIAIFTIIHVFARLSTPRSRSLRRAKPMVALHRYLSYRSFSLGCTGWYSPVLGRLIILFLGTIFFTIMTFASTPYYWPSTKKRKFGDAPPLAVRTGWMALALLPFVLALGSKVNLITLMTGISHEKLQDFHQWALYAMYVLALVHTTTFISYHNHKGDLSKVWKREMAYWTGTVALVAQTWLTIMTIGPTRRRLYEMFRITHLIAALVFGIFSFFHCNFRLSSWDYFIASATLYFSSLMFSLIRTFFVYGPSHQAFITPIAGKMLRVQIPVSSATRIGLRMIWRPGQHIFVRFLSLGAYALTSHPFPICSLPPAKDCEERCEIVLCIRPKGSFTRRLAILAKKKPGTAVPVLLDGPYSGLSVKSLADFHKALIIAGGAGAGFTLPVIEDILNRKDFDQSGIPRVTRIHVVIAVSSLELRDWYAMEMQRLLYRYASAEFLRIDVYVTSKSEGSDKVGPFDDWNLRPNISLSSSLTIFRGRPDIHQIIQEASVTPYTTVGIVSCGPPEMLYNVRHAASKAQLGIMKGGAADEVYLHTEEVM